MGKSILMKSIFDEFILEPYLEHSKPFVIVLDAGHGFGLPHNRGALCYNEGDNNFYYSLVLKAELEKIPGVIVRLTRNKITDNPSFDYRGRIAEGADLLLSLHSDAFNKPHISGVTIFDSVRHPNRVLASALANSISSLFDSGNRGVQFKEGRTGWDWYAILRNSKAKSSMIIEHGFHTNFKDCKFFKDHHKQIAQATASVIRNHYGLGGVPVNTEKPISTPGNTIYYSQRVNNRGAGVKQLQIDLNKLGARIATDGMFGPGTAKAVGEFQAKYNLEVDRIAGPKTLNKIRQLLKPAPIAPTKAKLTVDGLLGPSTIKELQKYLGTPVDGIISRPSTMVKELQKRLNAGKL